MKLYAPKTQSEANNYVGCKVKMKVNSPSNKVKMGDVLTIDKIGWGNPCYYYMEEVGNGKYFTWIQFEILPIDEKFLKNELVRLTERKRTINDEMNSVRGKLEYLKETGQKEFDEVEYKSFVIIRAVRGDKKMGDLQLAKLVAQIVND